MHEYYDTETGKGLAMEDFESLFDEFLDEAADTVEIMGLEFYPSDVLQHCDPIAYRCYRNDYVSELVSGGDSSYGETYDAVSTREFVENNPRYEETYLDLDRDYLTPAQAETLADLADSEVPDWRLYL